MGLIFASSDAADLTVGAGEAGGVLLRSLDTRAGRALVGVAPYLLELGGGEAVRLAGSVDRDALGLALDLRGVDGVAGADLGLLLALRSHLAGHGKRLTFAVQAGSPLAAELAEAGLGDALFTAVDDAVHALAPTS
ncbi:MAG: hypothetical protein ACKVWR_17205 [Acidimicrobiales bacterium]